MQQKYTSDIVINDSIKQNLKLLSSILNANRDLIASESLSSLNENLNSSNEEEYKKLYPMIKKILQNIKNPFKIMGLYNKLIMNNYEINVISSPLFQSTFFNIKLHPLLTCYLRDHTSYFTMDDNAQKIIDVFYKFMYQQHSNLMEINLKQNYISNIGKWFYDEGIANMFKKYYHTAQDFTYFISKFMLHGLVILFIAAACILEKKNFDEQLKCIQMIDIAYIKKYGLK